MFELIHLTAIGTVGTIHREDIDPTDNVLTLEEARDLYTDGKTKFTVSAREILHAHKADRSRDMVQDPLFLFYTEHHVVDVFRELCETEEVKIIEGWMAQILHDCTVDVYFTDAAERVIKRIKKKKKGGKV